MQGLVLHKPVGARRKLPLLAVVDTLPCCASLSRNIISSSLMYYNLHIVRCREISSSSCGSIRVQVSNFSIGIGGYEERDKNEINKIFATGSLSDNSPICYFPQNLLREQLKADYLISTTKNCKNQTRLSQLTPLFATLKSPKGFGAPKRSKKSKKPNKNNESEEEDEEEEEEEEGVIPEIVTNRMISRMGFTVGIPLFIGLLFFPFFYYLKVGVKLDVPTWVPFIVSFIFFGTALLGVSYGIVSSSWDPMREGSLLGWNEAKKNWPVFRQSFWGAGSKRK